MILNTLILNRVEKFDAAPEPKVLIEKSFLISRGGGGVAEKIIIYVRSIGSIQRRITQKQGM